MRGREATSPRGEESDPARCLFSLMIAPNGNSEATPLCYASSERIGRMRANSAKQWKGLVRGLALAALLFGGAAWRVAAQQEPAIPAPSQTAAGPVVLGVRIVREDGTVLKESPAGLAIEIGKSLDHGQVAASLRTLYRSGDYANLRAVAEAVDGGVRLNFVAEENLYFNQLILRGLAAPPSEASAAAAMQIQLGEVYRKEKLDAALERLRTILQEEGLYQAKVAAETIAHTEGHQMDVVVHVVPGARARISGVKLTNNTEYADVQITSRSKLKPGTAITSARKA